MMLIGLRQLLLFLQLSHASFGIMLVFERICLVLECELLLIAYLIWQQIGMASLIGVIGLLLKTVPVHTGLRKLLQIQVENCVPNRQKSWYYE
uniref:Uncharacterized protein n=1 Tax=Megaselia scalaris TaxID=36166 RepID=T1H3D1_MEGSC